jgi:hypothetical protein
LNAGKEGAVSPDGRARVELRDGGLSLTTAAGHTPRLGAERTRNFRRPGQLVSGWPAFRGLA